MLTKYTLPDDLYEYQKEDAALMSQEGKNFLNCSQMGTGKTPIALQVIESGEYRYPLIICPNSLKYEWQRQIGEWTTEKCSISRQNSYTRLKDIIHSIIYSDGRKYSIINYETFRSKDHLGTLKLLPFDIVILDEVHQLRNPNTQATKGIWEFFNAVNPKKVLGLSGSPIMNYPNDLYVPLSLIDPEEYPRGKPGWTRFMQRYCLWSESRGQNYIFGARNLPELRQRTQHLIVRRTKKEVLPFLPDKYYQRVDLEMDGPQKTLYNNIKSQLKVLLDSGEPLWSTTVLSTLTRLRQVNLDPKIIGITCGSAKTDFILDFLASTDEKVVIFSSFEGYIELLSNKLESINIQYAKVTGRVGVSDRSIQVAKFQENSDCRIFLGTIKAAGEGLTLTSSSIVIMADRWWNEPTNQQAIDRLHRIGQKNGVQVVLPICIESIDQVLDEILQRKHESSQEFLSESEVRGEVMRSVTYGAL